MAYIKIKPGVKMHSLRPEIWAHTAETADLFDQFGLECVITSAWRPKKPRSLHHGYALDFRANHIPNDFVRNKILNRLCSIWKSDYDVILHGDGDNIHFHIEYDPK